MRKNMWKLPVKRVSKMPELNMESIIELNDEDLGALADDAKAEEDNDLQRHEVYAWERSMNKKYGVSQKIDWEQSGRYLYECARLFAIQPPKYFIAKQEDMPGTLGVAFGNDIIRLSENAPPWVAIHEMAHIITNQMENTKRIPHDDYDGCMWAGHGKIFVGIYTFLMEAIGLWDNIDFTDTQIQHMTRENLFEREILDEGDTTTRKVSRWVKKFNREKLVFDGLWNTVDGYALEMYGDLAREAGAPSELIYCDNMELVDYAVSACHSHSDIEYAWDNLGKDATMDVVAKYLGGVNKTAELIRDTIVSELCGVYEEVLADQYAELLWQHCE